jgi:four helix bundle protein
MVHFFLVSMRSSSELEYLILLAHDLHYLEDETYQVTSGDLLEIRRMLNSYIQKLKTTLPGKKTNH